jgi:hypothetical protein
MAVLQIRNSIETGTLNLKFETDVETQVLIKYLTLLGIPNSSLASFFCRLALKCVICTWQKGERPQTLTTITESNEN